VCGVVGLKPTHGLVPTDGMFPRAYSIDHAGTLTRTVRDAAFSLAVLAREKKDYALSLDGSDGSLRGLRLGVDRSFVQLGEPEVLSIFARALETLAELGGEIVDVDLPDPAEMMAIVYTIFFCEWGVAHEPWMREHPEEYDEGSRATLLIPAADYLKAQQRRRRIQARFAEAMKGVDLLVSPTYPMVRREHRMLPVVAGSRLTLDDALRYTMPYDLMGLPAISIPGGFADADAPVGFQIAGRAFEEALVLRAADAFERASGLTSRHPAI
jgi:aspartyl-tRNA(Asn)/glutamyl-tRNA(Gln) amidotransferase subunit A